MVQFGERNSKYFYNLEKRNHKKNHIITLVTDDIREPKQILQEEKDFFQDIYSSKWVSPESDSLEFFFQPEELKKLNHRDMGVACLDLSVMLFAIGFDALNNSDGIMGIQIDSKQLKSFSMLMTQLFL